MTMVRIQSMLVHGRRLHDDGNFGDVGPFDLGKEHYDLGGFDYGRKHYDHASSDPTILGKVNLDNAFPLAGLCGEGTAGRVHSQ